VKYYVVRYQWQYDTIEGGDQACTVSGAWIGYHMPTGAKVVNAT
jgi:hypothetical protein